MGFPGGPRTHVGGRGAVRGLARERAAGARGGSARRPTPPPGGRVGEPPGPRLVSGTRTRGCGPGTRGREALRGKVRQPLFLAVTWSPGRAATGVRLRVEPAPLLIGRRSSAADPRGLRTASASCRHGPGSGTVSQPLQPCKADTAGPASPGIPGYGPDLGHSPKPHLLSLC